MKKLMFVMLASFLMIFGCSKDNPMIEDNENVASGENLKCKPITLPMQVWFSSVPDYTIAPVQCIPAEFGNVFVGGGGWIKGHATQIGKVNVKRSPWIDAGCSFGPNPGQITEQIQGKITGATGDFFNYVGYCTITFADASLTGKMDINGGSGKFKGATGSVVMNGSVNFETGISSWTGVGTITFPKKH